MIREMAIPTIGTDFAGIRWISDRPDEEELSFRSPDGKTQFLRCEKPIPYKDEFLFAAGIDGLSPATQYEVSARDAEAGGMNRTFRTLPAPPGKRLFRFGILADSHCAFRDKPGSPRLFWHSLALTEKYLGRLADLGAEFAVLPGDLTDNGTPDEVEAVRKIVAASPIPCQVLIGNHEFQPELFLKAFGLGKGWQSSDHHGFHFVRLRTFTPDELHADSEQFRWLTADLAANRDSPTFLFSHFSLHRHETLVYDPDCAVDNVEEIQAAIRGWPQVHAAFAGHKNMPTLSVVDGVAHVLSPQVVHYECGFDTIDVYEDGFIRIIYEIDELDLIRRSEKAHESPQDIAYRYGLEEGRNFYFSFRRQSRENG
ncbi:MAG: metallophosphoesterase [Planctomycetes bacterium]|nr:metallophosphoesterase [Planctomycetota bacterium]